MHITGALPSWKGTVQISAFGPFASAADAKCDGTAGLHLRPTTRRARSRFLTPPATFAAPGWYAYQEVVPGDDDNIGLTTPCGVKSELVQVQAAPTLGTHGQRAGRGAGHDDRRPRRGRRALGPDRHRSPHRCTARSRRAAAIVCTGHAGLDGHAHGRRRRHLRHRSRRALGRRLLHLPGEHRRRATSSRACTTGLLGHRRDDRRDGHAAARHAGQLAGRCARRHDHGHASPSRASACSSCRCRRSSSGRTPRSRAIDCSGTPVWTGTFTAKGDGEYVTRRRQGRRRGLLRLPRVDRGRTRPTRRRRRPAPTRPRRRSCTRRRRVETLVSNAVVRPGSIDHRPHQGRPASARPRRTIDVELFGPFASRDAISCGGTPVYSGKRDREGRRRRQLGRRSSSARSASTRSARRSSARRSSTRSRPTAPTWRRPRSPRR